MTQARRVYENDEYAEMMRRMLTGWFRRCADGDPNDLTELLDASKLLDQGIRSAVEGQRARFGTSWTEIGAAAGITRQAAQQRWGKK